jgi:predicted PurR-regulated permease PerM
LYYRGGIIKAANAIIFTILVSFIKTSTMHSSRQWIITGAIVVVGLFLLYALQQFLTPFLGAVIIYVISQPVMHYLVTKKKWKKVYAIILILFASFFVILIPFAAISFMLTTKISSILSTSPDFSIMLHQWEQWLYDHLGVHISADAAFTKVQELASSIVPGFLNAILNTLFDLLIMYFMLFYMLNESGSLLKRITQYLPFTTLNDKVFVDELHTQTISNAIGIPLMILIQGVLAWVDYLIFGVNEAGFWAVFTGFLSILPVVGSAIIWVPAGLIKIASGQLWMGIGIIAFGAIVIVNADHFFRFWIQKKIANIHPLVTIFGVIIGLQFFGFPGIIFGPLLISYFLILLKTYKSEFLDPPKD